MSQPAKTFDELSVPEQILHVQELWDRIAAHPEQVPVTEAHDRMVRRAARAGDAVGVAILTPMRAVEALPRERKR